MAMIPDLLFAQREVGTQTLVAKQPVQFCSFGTSPASLCCSMELLSDWLRVERSTAIEVKVEVI